MSLGVRQLVTARIIDSSNKIELPDTHHRKLDVMFPIILRKQKLHLPFKLLFSELPFYITPNILSTSLQLADMIFQLGDLSLLVGLPLPS